MKRGISANAAVLTIDEMMKSLETKIANLTKGQRLYNLVWAVGLPINGITKLLTGSLGVSLLSSPTLNLSQIQVIGGIIFGAMVVDALIMSIREGLDPSDRATRCGSVALRYTKLLDRLKLKKHEYSANTSVLGLSEAAYYELMQLKDEEAFIALDEPSFVWIGHGKHFKTAVDNSQPSVGNPGVGVDEIPLHHALDVIREIADRPITARAAEKLSAKIAKYSSEFEV